MCYCYGFDSRALQRGDCRGIPVVINSKSHVFRTIEARRSQKCERLSLFIESPATNPARFQGVIKKIRLIKLLVGAIAITAATAAFNGTPGARDGIQTSDTRPAGKPNEGFALALSASTPAFRLGEPMFVTLELRNASTDEQHVTFGASGDIFTETVVDERSGKPLPLFPESGGYVGGPSAGWSISPGQSWFFEEPLDKLVRFTHPGRYIVTFSSTHVMHPETFKRIALQSNLIEIDVFRR